MMDGQMENLRLKLNKMIESKDVNKEELLKVSEELDILIVKSMKEKHESNIASKCEILNELEQIMDGLCIFRKMYQSLRLVNPINKKVYEIKNNELIETGALCHELWYRKNRCENCISIRAYNENNTMYKLEMKDNYIYMVTAIPVNLLGRPLVIELLNDVTNSMMMSYGEQNNSYKIFNVIDYLNRAAVRDNLTNLYNRRYFNERLKVDLLNAIAVKEPLSVIFADIDFFKKVNDNYGHKAGDFILKEIAKELKSFIKDENHWAARYGGEEFFICLNNTDINSAISLAEQIRVHIEQKKFIYNKQIIRITCSFGVESIPNNCEHYSVDNLIDSVDKKLYEAKNSGRNRVIG